MASLKGQFADTGRAHRHLLHVHARQVNGRPPDAGNGYHNGRADGRSPPSVCFQLRHSPEQGHTPTYLPDVFTGEDTGATSNTHRSESPLRPFLLRLPPAQQTPRLSPRSHTVDRPVGLAGPWPLPPPLPAHTPLHPGLRGIFLIGNPFLPLLSLSSPGNCPNNLSKT